MAIDADGDTIMESDDMDVDWQATDAPAPPAKPSKKPDSMGDLSVLFNQVKPNAVHPTIPKKSTPPGAKPTSKGKGKVSDVDTTGTATAKSLGGTGPSERNENGPTNNAAKLDTRGTAPPSIWGMSWANLRDRNALVKQTANLPELQNKLAAQRDQYEKDLASEMFGGEPQSMLDEKLREKRKAPAQQYFRSFYDKGRTQLPQINAGSGFARSDIYSRRILHKNGSFTRKQLEPFWTVPYAPSPRV